MYRTVLSKRKTYFALKLHKEVWMLLLIKPQTDRVFVTRLRKNFNDVQIEVWLLANASLLFVAFKVKRYNWWIPTTNYLSYDASLVLRVMREPEMEADFSDNRMTK